MKIVSVESYYEAEEILLEQGYFNDNGTWLKDEWKVAFIILRENFDVKYNISIAYVGAIVNE